VSAERAGVPQTPRCSPSCWINSNVTASLDNETKHKGNTISAVDKFIAAAGIGEKPGSRRTPGCNALNGEGND
jgi:hypothetical protein